MTKPEIVQLVNFTFGQLQLIFGRKYTSRFGSSDDVVLTKRMWAKGFALAHVNSEAIDHAVSRIITQGLDWPPELPEFLQLCDESLAAGLPSPDDALRQIIKRRGAERFNDDFTWRHRVVEYTNEQVGHYIHKESEKAFNSRFKTAYRNAVYLFRVGKLPEKREALPPPEQAPITANVKVNPNCPLQKRLAVLRKSARSK